MLSRMHCIAYNTYQLFSLLWLFFYHYDWFLLLWLLAYVRYFQQFLCVVFIWNEWSFMVTFSQSKFIVLNLYRLSLCDQVTKFDKFWTLIKTNLNQNKQKTLWKYDNLMVKNLHSPKFGCKKNHENYFFCLMDL